MNFESELRDAIVNMLATEVKAHSLVEACVRFGLAGGTGDEAWASKAKYVERRLSDKTMPDLLAIGDSALRAYQGYKTHAFRLNEALRLARAQGVRRISEITRKNLLDELMLMGPLEGRLELDVFLRKLWPIDDMASHDPRHNTLGAEIWRHMIANEDWTPQYLLDRLGVMSLSDEAFIEMVELLVHPSVRLGDEQKTWVEAINKHLRNDQFVLAESGNISSYPVYRVRTLDAGVNDTPKNLIFASNGPKPEIVLSDAIHNDLKVVKHGNHCLFYDRPILERGLLWVDLVRWWAEKQGLDPQQQDTARSLYARLFDSLDSKPERRLFRAYFRAFMSLGDRLPAIIPQVYVHFDPHTVKELYGEKRLPRQRMDFLLLLAYGKRIVIEVDGVQHYSDNERPSPQRYAEMVVADRQLRLCGYEVYRFGGAEFNANGAAATPFFEDLFRKHQIS